MPRLEVHKFGGTSVAGAERLRAAAELVAAAAAEVRLVVVTSAMAGVTDALLGAAAAAAAGDDAGARERMTAVRAQHLRTLHLLAGAAGARAPEPEIRAQIVAVLEYSDGAVGAVAALRELTPRSRDRIVAAGEKLAVRLLAEALRARGVDAHALDADDFLDTDGRFGQAATLSGATNAGIRAALQPLLDAGVVPIVTGFLGRAPDGATTTLGRGGSDLSATIIAAALAADEVTIWTDVDGVFSADPRIVPDARVVPQLNYREAAELAYYGGKVLHPRTIIPVAEPGIPVRIRSALTAAETLSGQAGHGNGSGAGDANGSAAAAGEEHAGAAVAGHIRVAPPAPDPSETAGTIVDGRSTPGSHPVKCISAIRGQALVSVEGKGMAGVPGVAARVFAALAAERISVTMISQSSSEASITLSVPTSDAPTAERALKREFRTDITLGNVDDVVVRPGIGIVAAVGLGMAHTPGIAGRVMTALGRAGTNVRAIAQGSSELNISLAVDDADVDEAVRRIHRAFGLHRLDTGDDTRNRLDLILLGSGKIGRALVELVLERRTHFLQRFGLEARVVALADRSGYLLRPSGIPVDELLEAVSAKRAARPLVEFPGGQEATEPAELVRDALRHRLVRPVLVDVSDADDSGAAMLEALLEGCDVVTANKKPLAASFEEFRAMQEAAHESGALLRAEATVGAGLPIIDTLVMLVATGDRVTEMEGCFSGTLGFVLTRVEEGMPFSEAVAEAERLGYTEPDPVVDLSGVDVARKALILARISGLVTEEVPLALEGLVDPKLGGLPRAELRKRLKEYDRPLAERAAAARKEGKVLRYLARIAPGKVEVGLAAVAADSPPGALHGTDNLVLFRSERYDERPLVVVGPGAGIPVTAMGVLTDIARIAAERRAL